MTPRDVISAIAAPTGDIGAAYYFHPDTLARGKELGLDGFRFYALGRGGVLGDVDAEVVLSAFGYFEPGLVAKLWNSGRTTSTPPDAAREHLECAAKLGRTLFASLDGLDAYADAAAAVVAAVDVAALPLFAGFRSQPVPADAPARAFHHAVLLRELRGSAHLVAVRATGLPTVVAHAIKRPNDLQAFGWAESPVVTDDHRAALERAEAMTDDIVEPAFAVLDEAAAEALVAGTTAMRAAIG
jgi:hypothetical protein